MDLRFTDFSDIGFTDLQMNMADLAYSNLRRAYLNNTQLKNAYFVKSDLQEAQLINTDLEGAHCEKANFTGSNFQGANLKDVTFCKSCLINADLSDALNLTQEQVESAQIDLTTKLPPELEGIFVNKDGPIN